MRRFAAVVSLTAFAISLFPSRSAAQPQSGQPRIPGRIDDRRTVRLPGNVHPLARPEYDAGAADPAARLERMILVLAPDAAPQQALAAWLAAQQDPHSPLYHQWLTPEDFAARFGVAERDLDRVAAWLGAHGFSIDEIPAGGWSILFSGTAGQVESAFHTRMRRYRVGGEWHLANASDPEIPEALAGVVSGIATLHDFRRRAMHTRWQAAPHFTNGPSQYYLAPGDFATIYDVAALYGGGIDGTGQSLAIVGRSNISLSDVRYFRATFGLPANDPAVVVNGTDPGILAGGEEIEADLDVEWSGAVAPKAAVTFVVSASTYTTDGVDLSALYIVSHNLAPVMSTSFGSCEAGMGAAEMSFYNSLWQQAAVQGITALISSGDSGAAGCDSPSESSAGGGLAVNGLCSSIYSVCVGGTEFQEGGNPNLYWSAGNASNWSSALGYIPEVAWNESGANGGSGLVASGGGASAYYAKPAWQTGPGVPPDGRRDVPDVSLSAAGHDGYIIASGGSLWSVGGTSAASPSFAGLMALVNQQTGSAQGNANPAFYALASLEASGGLAYFHDVASGNNTVPGLAGFAAGPGYDQATGLGSVDAAILVNHWNDATATGTPSMSLSVTPGTITVAAGASGSVTAQVTVTGGPSSSVTLAVSGVPAGVTAVFASTTLAAPGAGSSLLTISAASNAAAGTYPLTISAADGGLSKTFPLSLTVPPPPACTLAASPAGITVIQGSSSTAQVSCGSVQAGFKTSLKLSVSGAPQGATVSVSPASLAPGTAKSTVTVSTTGAAPVGSFPLTLSATGGTFTQSLQIPLTINPAPTFTMSVGTSSIGFLQGASGQTAVTTAHVGSFNAPIALSASGAPAGVTTSFSPATINAPGDGASTLTVQAGPSAAAGTYNLTIKAAGGGQTKNATIRVTIQQLPGFTLSAAAKTITVGQGTIGGLSVTISGLVGGFNSAVALGLSASNSLPTGLNPSFTPASTAAPGAGASILALAPDGTSTPGTYALTITAAGAGVTHTVPLSVTVTPPPSFTLHPAGASLSLLAGGAGSMQITSTAAYGFQSPVALSAGTPPAGAVVAFQPSSMNGNGGKATMTVQTSSAAAPGSYTISVTGAGGGVTNSATVALNVGQLTLTPAATAITVARGASASLAVQTSVSGPYNSSAALSVTGLPKGVTGSFSPATIANPASGASTLKLTAASSAARGTQTIVLNASSGGVIVSAVVSLTVQ